MPAPRKYQKPGQESQPPIKPAPLPKVGGSQSLVLREGPPSPANGETKSAGITPGVPRKCDETRVKNIREALKSGWTNISSRTLGWLQEGTRLEDMLAETKLRDVGIFAGISTEKVLLLEGQPTQIIAAPQQAQLDKIGQALQTVMQQRGLSKEIKVTRETATINIGDK